MKQIQTPFIFIFMILLLSIVLTGCSTQQDNTNVESISISLNQENIDINQRMVITLETEQQFDLCRYYIVKPSSSEILFAESDKCTTLIFNPDTMPLLFDEGEGTYKVKVIGQTDERITGMGLTSFTFRNE